VAGQAHEYRSLVLRLAARDETMQDRINAELDALGDEGWDVVGFTTESLPDTTAPSVLHTFVLRRVPMAGPRAGR
jgi:hypothetical protein